MESRQIILAGQQEVVRDAGRAIVKQMIERMFADLKIDRDFLENIRRQAQVPAQFTDLCYLLDFVTEDDLLRWANMFFSNQNLGFMVRVTDVLPPLQSFDEKNTQKFAERLGAKNIAVFDVGDGKLIVCITVFGIEQTILNILTATSKGLLDVSEVWIVPKKVFWKFFVERQKEITRREVLREISKPRAQFDATAFVDALIRNAAALGASDIHMGYFATDRTGFVLIRFRIDGMLRPMYALPVSLYEEQAEGNVVNAIVVKCGGGGKWHRGQIFDGKLVVPWGEKKIDVRVSIVPLAGGRHNTVMRLLLGGATSGVVNLTDLGFAPEQVEVYDAAMLSTNGVVIVAGPTGSGKSTTLNTLLLKAAVMELNTVTVEDPVEYVLKNARQVQVDNEAGITFAGALRAFLRHDPDIILVGEIRDQETAKTAFQAAITGHLVLSTIHASDTVSIVSRLRQYDVEVILLKSALKAISSQRLVRTTCKKCGEWVPVEDKYKRLLEFYGEEPPEKEFRGRGCPACGNTGYVGRTVVAEVVPVKKVDVDALIEADSQAFIRSMKENGIPTLMEHGLKKVREGLTTVEEILRVG